MKKLLFLILPIIFLHTACTPSNEELLAESRAHMGNGAYSQALPVLDHIIKKDPENKAAYNMRGIVLLETGQLEFALRDFNYSVRLDSSDYRSLYNRGNAHYRQQNFNLAIRDYDKALRLEPKVADIYINRGNALVQLENYTQAMLDYQFALKLDDGNYLTHFNLARTLYLTSQPDEAKLSFEKCLGIYDTFAPAYYFLGMIAMEKDEPETSCIYLRKAADLGYGQAAELLRVYCNQD